MGEKNQQKITRS